MGLRAIGKIPIDAQRIPFAIVLGALTSHRYACFFSPIGVGGSS
jgi:hypothetical protein